MGVHVHVVFSYRENRKMRDTRQNVKQEIPFLTAAALMF